jgi:hypothetical protein
MKQHYLRPDEHHWIILRLLEAAGEDDMYASDWVRSLRWLMKQVGEDQLRQMIAQLKVEGV